MNEFNPHKDPSKLEIERILRACNISQYDRIVLTIDPVTDQPEVQIQHLDYPLGKFFKSVKTWKTQRTYRGATYERLLTSIKSNPEWLTFDTAFELGNQYQF